MKHSYLLIATACIGSAVSLVSAIPMNVRRSVTSADSSTTLSSVGGNTMPALGGQNVAPPRRSPLMMHLVEKGKLDDDNSKDWDGFMERLDVNNYGKGELPELSSIVGVKEANGKWKFFLDGEPASAKDEARLKPKSKPGRRGKAPVNPFKRFPGRVVFSDGRGKSSGSDDGKRIARDDLNIIVAKLHRWYGKGPIAFTAPAGGSPIQPSRGAD